MTRHSDRWKSRYGRALALTVGLGLLALGPAASREQPDFSKSTDTRVAGRDARANYLLPARVPAPDGQLTLWADFAHAGEGRIPLYLVNRTREPVTFGSIGGSDIYLKLEAQLPDGRWQRAQAHYFPACGNAYSAVTLPAGRFWLLAGVQPAAGTSRRAPVRFALYSDRNHPTPTRGGLVSNAGEGLVRDVDIAAANQDELTSRLIPFAAEWRLRYDELAVDPARKTPWAEIVAKLRLVARWEENGFYRARAQGLLARARADGSPEAPAAAEAIAALLPSPWPPAADPAAFVRRCAAELRAPVDPGAEFGAPAASPAVLWRVLYVVAVQFGFDGARAGTATLPRALWQDIVDTAQRQIETTPAYSLTALLGIPAVADEFVADRFFEERLGSARWEVRRLAAETLGRRARFARLVALGRELPPDRRIEVLTVLAGGRPTGWGAKPGTNWYRDPASAAETAFWAECVRAQPLAAMAALEYADDNGRGNRDFPREIEVVVQAYLRAEAAKVADQADDFQLPPSAEFDRAL